MRENAAISMRKPATVMLPVLATIRLPVAMPARHNSLIIGNSEAAVNSMIKKTGLAGIPVSPVLFRLAAY
jgi:hypothetical protein